LVNAIPPVVREPFFYFAFEYSIALPRRGNLAAGGGEGGEKGTTPRNPRWRSTLLPSDKDPFGLACATGVARAHPN
jgi:hypothetical protein